MTRYRRRKMRRRTIRNVQATACYAAILGVTALCFYLQYLHLLK